MLAINTDYAGSTGCAEPTLRRIAEAGFSHIHWCHQWCTDFLYSGCEIEQIGRWLAEYDLKLLDLHASAGVEKCWFSGREYERLAGVELVKNRIDMTAALGGDVIMIHTGSVCEDPALNTIRLSQLRKSLDELQGMAGERKVRIAIENLPDDIFPDMKSLLAEYPADFVGVCYDSGHGNITGNGLDELESMKGRLISMHLHDNDSTGDQHKLPFTESIDWRRLARIIASSSYQNRPLSFEVGMRSMDTESEEEFLGEAFIACTKFSDMVDELR